MSSNNNTEFAGLFMAFALLGLFLWVAAALLFGAIALLSFVFSIVALVALERPTTLFGEVITREEAKAYLWRGVIGAAAVPVIVLTFYGMLGARFNLDYFWLLPIGGYAFGSLVVGYWIEEAKTEAAQRATAMQPLLLSEEHPRTARTIDIKPSVAPRSDEKVQSQPFRFATWDDEEELRK